MQGGVGLGSILIAMQAACGRRVVEVPPAPASIATLPGVWAVFVDAMEEGAGPTEPEPPLERGEAARRGALAGAKGSVVVGATMAGGVLGDRDAGWLGPILAAAFLVGGIVLAPVAALVGAASGSAAGSSPDEIAAAQASMQATLRERQSATAWADLFISEADRLAGRSLADCGAARAPSACELPDGTVPDILVTLTFGQPLFEIEGEIQPKLRLVQNLSAEVRPLDVATPIHARIWVYRGRQNRYVDLAADDARLLQQAFATARAALVGKAVNDLFLPMTRERHVEKEQPEGTVWTVIPPAQPVRGQLSGSRR